MIVLCIYFMYNHQVWQNQINIKFVWSNRCQCVTSICCQQLRPIWFQWLTSQNLSFLTYGWWSVDGHFDGNSTMLPTGLYIVVPDLSQTLPFTWISCMLPINTMVVIIKAMQEVNRATGGLFLAHSIWNDQCRGIQLKDQLKERVSKMQI